MTTLTTRLGLMGCAVACALSVPAFAQYGGPGVVVRAGPGPNFEAIGRLNGGDITSLRSCDPATGWCEIRLGEDETPGYVPQSVLGPQARVIQDNPEEEGEGAAVLREAELKPLGRRAPDARANQSWQGRYAPEAFYANATSSVVNVRSGPGTSYRVVSQVGPGQGGTIQTCNGRGDWCEISLGGSGRTGWVYMPYFEGRVG